jgi:hypothetical protein
MPNTQVTRFSTFPRRLLAAGIALTVVGALLAPGGAHAQDNDPTGVPGTSCAIEVSDGNGNVTVQQVPVGTHVGLLYCGQDGDWHLGWLVDGRQVTPPTHPVLSPPRVSASQFVQMAPPSAAVTTAVTGTAVQTHGGTAPRMR